MDVSPMAFVSEAIPKLLSCLTGCLGPQRVGHRPEPSQLPTLILHTYTFVSQSKARLLYAKKERESDELGCLVLGVVPHLRQATQKSEPITTHGIANTDISMVLNNNGPTCLEFCCKFVFSEEITFLTESSPAEGLVIRPHPPG